MNAYDEKVFRCGTNCLNFPPEKEKIVPYVWEQVPLNEREERQKPMGPYVRGD